MSLSTSLPTIKIWRMPLHRRQVTRNTKMCFEISSINIINSEIYPPFFEEYIKLCQIPSIWLPEIDSRTCITTLTLPSITEQIQVLQDIEVLEKSLSVEPIKPYLIHYMITDMEKAKNLLFEYQRYLLITENLQDMIKYAIIPH